MSFQADRAFLNVSPLSEVVWLPKVGPSLKCTDSSVAENRKTLRWNTESFNLTTTGPDCISKENFGNGMLHEKLDSSQNVPGCKKENNVRVNSPPGKTVEIMPACPTMTHEQNSTNNASESPEEIERFPQGNEVSQAEANGEDNIPPEQTKVRGSSLENSQRNAAYAMNTTDKDLSKACDDVEAVGSLSADPANLATNHAESDKGLVKKAEDPQRRGNRDLDLAQGLALRCDTPGKSGTHLQCMDYKQLGKGFDAKDDGVKHHVHPQLTYLFPLEQRSNICNSLWDQQKPFLESFSGCGHEESDAVALEPTEDIKDETPNICIQFKSFQSISDTKEETRKIEKGQEEIGGFEEGANVEKNKENNHDDSKGMELHPGVVKGSNGKESSTSKRVWCFESNDSSRKKLKKIRHESSLGGTLPNQDGSSLNLITEFANALPSSVQGEMQVAPVLENAENKPSSSCPPSPNEGRDLHSNRVGFGSFFQTFAYPNSQKIVTGNADNQKIDVGSSEFQIPNRKSDNASENAYTTELPLHKPIPLATPRLDEHQLEERLPLNGMKSVGCFHVQGKQECIGVENQNIFNLVSSSSSIRIASTDPKRTEAGEPDFTIQGSNVMVASTGSEFLGSSWITRLCSKPSPFSSTAKASEALVPVMEKQHDRRNSYQPHLQNDSMPFNGNRCSGNEGILSGENQKYAMRNKEHFPNCLDASSMGVTLDEKPKAKLNPILPSKRIKRLEPITSVFAKRLDAFRHIPSSSIVDDLLYSASTCLFCGKIGHSMKDCSQVAGTELESLQKNISARDDPKDSVCLCIRCFQLNHWAIACPYSSKRSNPPDVGCHYASSFDFAKTDEPTSEDISRSERNHRDRLKNLATNNVGVEEFKSSHPKLMKDFPREPHFKGKNVLMSTVHSEDKGAQIMHLDSFEERNSFDQQTRIFEEIRGLRLSRTDLIRLMREHISFFNLEGYFLRVRLGKQEGILKGSDYHVACINGVPKKIPSGTTKNCIPVNISGFKCMLDCRFVSNNDFGEDELNCWWSAISKSGSKLPTEDQLKKKLQERRKFGI